MREETTRGMMPHEWGPSMLNHGAQQCLHCLCTDREAAFALGPRRPDRRPMAASLARRLHEGQTDQGGEAGGPTDVVRAIAEVAAAAGFEVQPARKAVAAAPARVLWKGGA